MKNFVVKESANMISLALLSLVLVAALLISGCQSAENKAAVAEMKQRLSNNANSTDFSASLEKIKFLGMMAATWEPANQDTLAQLLVAANKKGVDVTGGFNSLGDIKAETLSKRARAFLSHGELTEDQLVTLMTSKAGRLGLTDYDNDFNYKTDVETLSKYAILIEKWGPKKFDEVAGLS
ncbi:hypothetical protein HYY73_04140 [Candidatus Woesearchaeota archaeon]|nr:hypothetical protein [Candidatus Woesearchaeota archaeon]